MRIRMILLLVGIALLAALAAFNWGELARPAQLSWGFGTAEAPLGMLLLAALAISWVGFLVASSYLDTRYQLDAHRNAKALEAQRLLADKAEASRFTELRTYLESQASLAAQRDVASASRVEQTLRTELAGMRAQVERLVVASRPSGYAGGRDSSHVDVLDAEPVVVRQAPH